MTVATTIYYSGYHPYSLQKIDTAKSEKEKKQQNMFIALELTIFKLLVHKIIIWR